MNTERRKNLGDRVPAEFVDTLKEISSAIGIKKQQLGGAILAMFWLTLPLLLLRRLGKIQKVLEQIRDRNSERFD